MPNKPLKPRVTRKVTASPAKKAKAKPAVTRKVTASLSKKAKAKPAAPAAAMRIKGSLGPVLAGDAGLPRGVKSPVKLSPGAPPVESNNPQLAVAGIPKPGVYTFSVTVVDDLGVVSKPARIRVQVKPVPPVIG